jgi:hypothetical protein
MNYRTCLEAFKNGARSRIDYPLSNGAYKLRESISNFQAMREEVIRISEVIRGIRCPFDLQHCTNEDKAKWLRKVPFYTAYDMGHKIILGLRALEFDGVPQGQSVVAALLVELAMHQRLVKWNYLRDSYKNRIAYEYAHMRNGQSNALLVVDDALLMIDSALRTLPLNIQNEV